MRIRRITQADTDALAAWHAESAVWVDIDAAAAVFDPTVRGPLTTDLLDFLASRERGRDIAARLMESAVADGVGIVTDPAPALPYRPASLRCFLGWEQHWSQAAHQLIRRNLPAVMPVVRAYEALTRRDFPPLRPGASFAEHPLYYTGNHLSILADAAPIPWPAYTEALDFELEFGMIVDRPVRNATDREGADAIGGFVVFNDVSARDVQWDEQRNGSFGPVVKTKTFASTMGSVVVTADEVLPRIDALAASVVVDGETWSTTGTAGLRYSPGQSVAYASRGENIYPGELLTSGTLPSGCGLELDRWIRPGNVVTLDIELIGSVSNVVDSPERI